MLSRLNFRFLLYHTKNHRGTTTLYIYINAVFSIIPYQEPPGNYNGKTPAFIYIPDYTIPRTTGELQLLASRPIMSLNYTIPRTTGELQPLSIADLACRNYTIPRTTGELQPVFMYTFVPAYYTIPRTTGELQLLQFSLLPLYYYTIPRNLYVQKELLLNKLNVA